MNASAHQGKPNLPGGEQAAARPTLWSHCRGWLPHEVCFGLFLLVTWVRLGVVVGWLATDTLVFLGLILLNAAALWCCHARRSPWGLQPATRWRLGLLYYPPAMNFVFMYLKTAVPKIHPGKMDAFLAQADSLLIGTNLSLRAQTLVYPVLTEVFSFCYILFFPYLLFSLIYYFVGDWRVLRKFVIGLFTIYGLGFLGYSFVPAAGPCHAMAGEFSVPLSGGWLTRANVAVVAMGSNGVDVFPSLHCAVSCFLLCFDRKHHPRTFWLCLLPCVGLWCSTIYLRYHYFIDVVCGFALAGLALWLANRFPRKSDPPAEGAAPSAVVFSKSHPL